MKIEKKKDYVLITADENSFSSFFSTLSKQLINFSKNHLVIHFFNDLNISKEDFLLFLNISNSKKENGTSFVIVNSSVDIDEYPETLNIVPTLQEAEDILEMEAIERELGF